MNFHKWIWVPIKSVFSLKAANSEKKLHPIRLDLCFMSFALARCAVMSLRVIMRARRVTKQGVHADKGAIFFKNIPVVV